MERRTKSSEQRYLELIAGPPKSMGSRLLRSILRVASSGYLAGVTFRNMLFDAGIKRSHAAPVPVISVGNLTTGGTGKTPTVALLVDLLKELGHRPGIISRGYRELSAGGNDEARVLELLCPGTPHVQNRDRVAAAREVAATHPAGVDQTCTVILADDAFQHRRLKRELDIVLIDALNPWGHDALLPRGLLREPVSGLRRADVVILTRADLVDESTRQSIWRTVQTVNHTAAVVELAFEPDGLIDKLGVQRPVADAGSAGSPQDASSNNPDCTPASAPLAFCGIGNPDGFRRTLDAAGISILDLVAFPDHHHYQPSDLQQLTDMAQEMSATSLLTTAKDLVKIQLDWVGSVPLFALNIKAKITSGRDALDEAISRIKPPPTR
jgi:tetraacyldisaccharide 4'-kinase